MYSLCGNIRTDYYLKVRDVWVWLISCLPNFNKNSVGEYVRVSGNWLATWHWSVSYIFNCVAFSIFLVLIFIETDTNLLVLVLMQKARSSNWTSELCTWEILIFCSSQRYLCILTGIHASHLILGCNPVYSSWQPFGQALLVDNPLLSYIDVRHPNFLPSNLTVGEARDFVPRIVRAESLVPVRDDSV